MTDHFRPLADALPKGSDVARVRSAYELANEAHGPQLRASGLPYIVHPVAVARLLAELGMDDDTLVAALLHDVLEDCEPPFRERIEREFGGEVLHLIEGVTKLKIPSGGEMDDRERFVAETERTAETLRKMLLAMAKDFRVMVIKLADRLHNMTTLEALAPRKQIRIAKETLDVYAPLAARLGIWQFKWQLEDLAFKTLHPDEFRRVSDLVGRTRKQREAQLDEVIATLRTKFGERNIRIEDLRGRPKHLYSIFNKMVKQKVKFEEIYDLLALRVIVDTVPDCYVALGVIHETYVPIPVLFYDYIARPKPNGYRSLHTKVVGPGGQPLEVQIRTTDMHAVAEHGVAAHWTYKEGKSANDETRRLGQLRQQLFDWSSDAQTSSDYLRTLSTDLFSEQVFVFTPKGDVIDMPKESTPIDFAFRVHSQLGLKLVGAKVNGTMVPLAHALQNGDVVELVTRGNAQPSWDWIDIARSAHTKAKLRGHFRKLSKGEDATRGRQMLEKELLRQKVDPKDFIGEEKIQKIADAMNDCESATDVLAKVGSGLLSAQALADRLRGIHQEQPPADRIEITKSKEGKLRLSQDGIDNVLVKRAPCCAPIPGDEVVGYVSRGKGIVVHRRVCPNAQGYEATEPERLMQYEWPSDGHVYQVPLRIVCMNRSGLLMDITAVFGESKTNVSSARVKTTPTGTADIDVTLDVADHAALARLMDRVLAFRDVISVARPFGRTPK